MALTTISAITTIVANATKALDSLRQQAQSSKDLALKENIGKLYDSLLELKELLGRLIKENEELRRRTIEGEGPKPEPREVGKAVYLFVGEEGPFCQPCYVKMGKLVKLPPLGNTGRQCTVCGQFFREKDSPAPPKPEPWNWT